METTLGIDRCAVQLGRRWPTISPERAAAIAAYLAVETPLRDLSPEHGADEYVRSLEEEAPVEASAFVLVCTCDGADDDLLGRAVAAAEEVFLDLYVSPARAARVHLSRSRGGDTRLADGQDTQGDLFTGDELLGRAVVAAEGALVESRTDVAGLADGQPTEGDRIAGEAWDQAEAAAFAVCAAGLQYGPPRARLHLRWRSDA